jgi:hypothetical protein
MPLNKDSKKARRVYLLADMWQIVCAKTAFIATVFKKVDSPMHLNL